uniref:(California timema) hypothetical protein n=1 Tax=Timema californicum TaxID=61474 RepID=A0A7R9P9U9_TIMCA|nr:unnamed protein product [Timema californicum]
MLCSEESHWGGMATASYVYVAEISQAEHRGTLSAAGPIHVSFGVLAVYILGYIAKWQLVAAVCTICAVLSFLAMCMVPESPPWLASQGRVGEAKAALVWLGRSPSNAEAELDELLDSDTQVLQARCPCPGSSGSDGLDSMVIALLGYVTVQKFLLRRLVVVERLCVVNTGGALNIDIQILQARRPRQGSGGSDGLYSMVVALLCCVKVQKFLLRLLVVVERLCVVNP